MLRAAPTLVFEAELEAVQVAVLVMGRRGVQQLSPAQWREALEQQIREKEQLRQDEKGADRASLDERSQSAPHQEGGGVEAVQSVPGLERAATSDAGVGNDYEGGGRRRFQQTQSREEYRNCLEEQIEEKKRLAHEQLEKERSQRRVSRSKEDDGAGRVDEERGEDSKPSDPAVGLRPQTRLKMKISASSNQEEFDHIQTPGMQTEGSANPEAISKIVEFCEELKKQNEDVKQQLLQQHAVLASLHSTLAVDSDIKESASDSRRRSSALRVSVSKSQVLHGKLDSSIKKAQSKGSEAKFGAALQVAPRPRPMRGETKIPLPRNRHSLSLRSAGTKIIQGFIAEKITQSISPLKRAEAKCDPGERRDNRILTEKRAMQFESPCKGFTKDVSPASGGCNEMQDPQRGQPESESKEYVTRTSSEKEIDMKWSDSLNDTDHVKVGGGDSVEDEQPMETDSKLVHNWESDAELPNCTSISILDGSSSLIPLDRSLSQLF